jgi:hypothetical protein
MAKDPVQKEAGMLRDYLRGVPKYPSFVPQLPGWVPWLVFFTVLVALYPVPMRGTSWVFALIAALSVPWFVRMIWKPRDAGQVAEWKRIESMRPMRSAAHEGSLRKRFPPAVLEALEGAACARIAALARIHSSGSLDVLEQERAVDVAMGSALLAAAPAFRKEDVGRKEWAAVSSNASVNGAIVDAIRTAEMRIQQFTGTDPERMAALRELDGAEISNLNLFHG